MRPLGAGLLLASRALTPELSHGLTKTPPPEGIPLAAGLVGVASIGTAIASSFALAARDRTWIYAAALVVGVLSLNVGMLSLAIDDFSLDSEFGQVGLAAVIAGGASIGVGAIGMLVTAQPDPESASGRGRRSLGIRAAWATAF